MCAAWLAGVGCAEPTTPVDPVPDPVPSEPTPPNTSALDFEADQTPRNVLMISIDTLRRDMLARYGGPGMPHLEALAADGVVLDDHLTCSNWTFMGVPCTLLGRDHAPSGFVPRIHKQVREPFPDDAVFLAEVLHDAGFRTGLHTGNGYLSPTWNTAQGYTDGVLDKVELPADAMLADALSTAQAWQAEGADRWFLHVHLMEPHAPYDPPEAYLEGLDALDPVPWDLSDGETTYDVAASQWGGLTDAERDLLEAHLRVRYTGEVAWLDDMLHDGLQAFEAAGLLDDTLVVLWSDHGETHFEHGQFSHAWHLYSEENDGVAVLWSETLQPLVWDGPTHAIDIAPTVLDAVRVPLPDEMTGVPVGADDLADRPRFLLTLGRAGGQSAVVDGDLKLIFKWPTGARELYDRATDPGETTDLAVPGDPRVDTLWTLLEPRVQQAAEAAPDASLVWPADR